MVARVQMECVNPDEHEAHDFDEWYGCFQCYEIVPKGTVDALKDVWMWGVSVPLGMSENDYNIAALRDIKRHAYAAYLKASP